MSTGTTASIRNSFSPPCGAQSKVRSSFLLFASISFVCSLFLLFATEGQCALIATGEATKSAVVAASLDLFRRKFLYFVKSIALMDELFEATFSAAESKGAPLSQCGKCDRFMTYYGADAPPPQRLVCTTCDEVHRLPPGGIVRQWSGHRCPLDNFELVLFDLGSASKTLGNTCVLCLRTRCAQKIQPHSRQPTNTRQQQSAGTRSARCATTRRRTWKTLLRPQCRATAARSRRARTPRRAGRSAPAPAAAAPSTRDRTL